MFQFVLDIAWNYLWFCCEKDTSALLPPLWKARGVMPISCVPACGHQQSLSRCITCQDVCFQTAHHMRQNAYFRNLKWTLEDLLPCYCYKIKTNSRTICLHVLQPASAANEWPASSPMYDTRAVSLGFVQCECHTGKQTVIAIIKSITWNWAADVRFSAKFWFLVQFPKGENVRSPLAAAYGSDVLYHELQIVCLSSA